MLEEFISSLEIERGLSGNTCQAYRTDCRRFLASLPPELIENPKRIDDRRMFEFLVAQRRGGRQVASVRRCMSALRTFFRFLRGRGLLDDDPTRYLDSPQSGSRLPSVLSVDEIDRLVRAAQEHPSRYPLRDRSLLELLYATGLRVGEAIGLSLESVRRDLGIVRCFGKGSRERIVPISRRALAAVDSYVNDERPRLAGRRRGSKILFLSRSGQPLGREVVRAIVQKYARLAGLTARVSPHVLRHSLATHLIRGGADLRIVQEILGHVRVETTEIYTHLDHSDLKRAHSKYHPRP
jgi:integrase/recombinase XerD